MAKRPVFVVSDKKTYYKEVYTEFTLYPGFALSQKQKSIRSLHEAFFLKMKIDAFEISGKSPEMLGTNLSAFKLTYTNGLNETFPVENIFQSSKVFEKGGPYRELLYIPPYYVKKDNRLHNSGDLIYFDLFRKMFSVEPKTFFYDWIYINALIQNNQLSYNLLKLSAFNDIEFNPEKVNQLSDQNMCYFCITVQSGTAWKCNNKSGRFFENGVLK